MPTAFIRDHSGNTHRKNPQNTYPLELVKTNLKQAQFYKQSTPLFDLVPYVGTTQASAPPLIHPLKPGFPNTPEDIPINSVGWMTTDNFAVPFLGLAENNFAVTVDPISVEHYADTQRGSYFGVACDFRNIYTMRKLFAEDFPHGGSANGAYQYYQRPSDYLVAYATYGVGVLANQASIGKKLNMFMINGSALRVPAYALYPSGLIEPMTNQGTTLSGVLIILTDAASLTAAEDTYTFATLVHIGWDIGSISVSTATVPENPLTGVTPTVTAVTPTTVGQEIFTGINYSGNTVGWGSWASNSNRGYCNVYQDVKLSELPQMLKTVVAKNDVSAFTSNGSVVSAWLYDTGGGNPMSFFQPGVHRSLFAACLAEEERINALGGTLSHDNLYRRAQCVNITRRTVPYDEGLGPLTTIFQRKAVYDNRGSTLEKESLLRDTPGYPEIHISQRYSVVPGSGVFSGVDVAGNLLSLSLLRKQSQGINIVHQYVGDYYKSPSTLTPDPNAMMYLYNAKNWKELLNQYNPLKGPEAMEYLNENRHKFPGIQTFLKIGGEERAVLGGVAAYSPNFEFITGASNGKHHIKGVAVANGVPFPKVPVYLFNRSTGVQVRATTSDAQGKYAFYGLPKSTDFFAVGIDPTKTYNCVSEEFGVISND